MNCRGSWHTTLASSSERRRSFHRPQARRCITLVLTRYDQEDIILTLPDKSTIRFLICQVDRGKVRVGIEADESINIRRGEIADTLLESDAKIEPDLNGK